MNTLRTSGKRKVLGILGGMGPEATVDFYREVIALTPARCDQDHIPTIVLSNPEIPNRTESILQGHHKALRYLIDGATFLEHAGADFIVIPCNTAHYYLNDLREGVRIPFLSIIDTTVDAIQASEPRPQCVGILASDGTCTTNLYGDALQRAGVRFVYPDTEHQPLVMQAIDLVKAGRVDDAGRDLLARVVCHVRSAGAEGAILGCTELPLLAQGLTLELPTFNPTRILAQAVVAFALATSSRP